MKVIPRDRLAFVEGLYLDGVPDHRIQEIASKKYRVTRRAVRRYIERVRAKLAALPKPSGEAAFRRSEAMLLEAYGLAKRAIKIVTVHDGIEKSSKEYATPETGVMATVAWRLAELHGLTSMKVDVTATVSQVAIVRVIKLPQRRPLDTGPVPPELPAENDGPGD